MSDVSWINPRWADKRATKFVNPKPTPAFDYTVFGPAAADVQRVVDGLVSTGKVKSAQEVFATPEGKRMVLQQVPRAAMGIAHLNPKDDFGGIIKQGAGGVAEAGMGVAANVFSGMQPANEYNPTKIADVAATAQAPITNVGDAVAGGAPNGPAEEFARSFGGNVAFGGPVAGAVMAGATTALTEAGKHKAVGPALGDALFSPTPIAQQDGIVPGTGVTAPTTVVDTIGGPAKVDSNDLLILGGTVAATIGMMFAPRVFQSFKLGLTPKPRPVFHAVPGTEDISTFGDVFRTQIDDASAGALRVAKRAGVDPVTIGKMQTDFHAHTRTGAATLGDTAVKYGEAITPTTRFKAKESLADISKHDSPAVREYLHLRSSFDELNTTKKANMPSNTRTTVHGMTSAQVLARINAHEANMPWLKDIGKWYRENTRQAHSFASTGEFATITKQKASDLNAQHANSTHVGHDLDGPLPNDSPFVAGADYVHSTIRGRLENETKGKFIDETRKKNANLFKPVTKAQLSDNPHWQKNSVTIYRRGKPEHYTTSPFLADVLKFDPTSLTTTLPNAMYAMKRFFESTTTGLLAPWFSVTSAGRNYVTGKQTMPHGLGPTVLGSVAAIPRQLIPQLAKAISVSIDNGSAGWLKSVFGNAGLDAISARLAKAFDDALFGRLEAQGTHQGSILQSQLNSRKHALANISAVAPGPVKQFVTNFAQSAWHGWKAVNNSIHNAPQFSSAARHAAKGIPVEDFVPGVRNMTGDTRVGGASYVNEGTGRRAIRIAGKNRVVTGVTHITGWGADAARNYVPWSNVIVQSAKRLGKAYVDNPVAFTAKTWLYTMMPAASAYLWNASLGPEYTDYMMNRRSGYTKTTSYYIGIPGKPPEQGIELPFVPQEMAIFKHMMEIGLDHATRSSYFTPGEDFKNAAMQYMGVTISPPLPPAGAALLGSQGIVPPMNAFGEQGYPAPKTDLVTGLPSSVDLLVRAFGGGLADVGGQGFASFVDDPGTLGDKVKSAATAAGTRLVEKTPIVRDFFNIHAPVSSSTDIADATYAKQDAITELGKFYSDITRNAGAIDTSPSSKQGEASLAKAGADDFGRIPGEKAGSGKVAPVAPPMPEPTNPLYKLFMQRVYQDFIKDSTKGDAPGVTRDAVGFKTLWQRHSNLTQEINAIKPINAGNYVTWQTYLDGHPEVTADLKANGVDTKNATAVRNYLVKERQDVQRLLLTIIRNTEASMSQEAGRPIKLEDLSPYSAQPPVVPMTTH